MEKQDKGPAKKKAQPKKKVVKKPTKKVYKNIPKLSDKAADIIEKKIETGKEKKKGGAPIGNQFWKQRSKHGTDKLFANAQLMKQAAEEYFEWNDNNPINDPRSFGGLAMIPRPYTLHGLTAFLGVNTGYFKDFKNALKPEDKDFSLVIKYIEETIYNQKYTHAAIGIYKENLIARDLGINDKMDVTTKGEKINTGSVILTPEEAEILNKKFDDKF